MKTRLKENPKKRLLGTVILTLCGVFFAWILYENGLKEISYLIVLILSLAALLYVYNAYSEESMSNDVSKDQTGIGKSICDKCIKNLRKSDGKKQCPLFMVQYHHGV